ncbi:hypothetical protein RDI58_025246 [Solanum bulbocastanum]|uniref:Uncharacterized protein n=1 Tax=Solanum bulbocastanum TaxID=147425 RepID=A0AAN8Y6F2_SOLBU
MVFGRKVFYIKPERDTFATHLGPHTTIGSLPHALCLHICNWCDTGQVFWACFDKVNSSVYSVNRVLLFGYSKGETLMSVDDASDVCDVSSETTTHKIESHCSIRLNAYNFHLILVYMSHMMLPFSSVTCKDIRSVKHIEYPCISTNHVVGAVSPSALEKYIDAYDFHQYLNFRNFNVSWQPYTDVAFSHGDNSYTMLGLLEQLNATGEAPVYLWYNSNVEINLTTDVLQSGNWPGLIVFYADQSCIFL